ncbi:SWI/SNF complex subunit SWI3B [Lathyrus oleraceus]|uniref:SWI/SNF complex subunit SWI3B n=1 Tax=Pisum sativum TaxID=3888 RepID=UPI001FC55512|nr:SWI/SNF complex subunit SWI3B-like [Pisum sativum]
MKRKPTQLPSDKPNPYSLLINIGHPSSSSLHHLPHETLFRRQTFIRLRHYETTTTAADAQTGSSLTRVQTLYRHHLNSYPISLEMVLMEFHSRSEIRNIPDSSKNPRVYKYYRNSIVKFFRFNPNRKITFTDVRKTRVGDVGSIRRVFDFLEAWGLINYHPSSSLAKPFKWEDKDTKTESASNSTDSPPAPIKETAKRICSNCKNLCAIACFACDKNNMTLCARCFVRGNYKVGTSNTDFKEWRGMSEFEE